MGLDGGTIITRSDILRGSSWDVANADGGASTSTRGGQVNDSYVHKRRRIDPGVRRQIQWTTCALSGEQLRAPIVCCTLGRLYNQETLLEHMLAKSGVYTSEEATYAYANRVRMAADVGHVRSRRDFFPVHLTPTTTAKSSFGGGGGGGGDDGACDGFECPVFGSRCGAVSGVGFSAIRPCGHVVSDKAIREATVAATGATPGASASKSKHLKTKQQQQLEEQQEEEEEEEEEEEQLEGQEQRRQRQHKPSCPVCEVPFDPAHCLPVHGTDAQLAELRAATEARHRTEDDAKAARAAAKKQKKEQK